METYQVPDVTPTPDKVYSYLDNQRQGLQVVIEQVADTIGTRLTVQEKLLGKIKTYLSRLINKRVKYSGDLIVQPIDRLSTVIVNRTTENNLRYDTVRNTLRTQPPPIKQTTQRQWQPLQQQKEPINTTRPAVQQQQTATPAQSPSSQSYGGNTPRDVVPTNPVQESTQQTLDGYTAEPDSYSQQQTYSDYQESTPSEDESTPQSQILEDLLEPLQRQSESVSTITPAAEKLKSIGSFFQDAILDQENSTLPQSQDSGCKLPIPESCTPLEAAQQMEKYAVGNLVTPKDMVNELLRDTPFKEPRDQKTYEMAVEWREWLSQFFRLLLG